MTKIALLTADYNHNELQHSNIQDLFLWADQHREEFWKSMVQRLAVPFHDDDEQKDDLTVFDVSKGVESPIYFPGRKMNAADWILTGDDSRTAIVWSKEGQIDDKGNPKLNEISLKSLKQSVLNIAYSLSNKLGLKPDDAVGIDMPMNWESVAIYLGIIKAGMAVVSIADSFASAAIEVRLTISDAKAVFTQDVIARGAKKIPLYDRVVKAKALKCIVLAEAEDDKLACKLRDCDMSWTTFLEGTNDETTFESVSCDSMDIANILFSSGTTGEPKAIPWHHSTFIKPLVDGYLHNDVRSGEVVAWPTNVGWMMGPWLISQMGLGSTIALFVGSPVGAAFCKFVETAQIAHLGVIPSMVKSWMRLDATKKCNWQCVRRFSSTGEASNPTLYHWLVSRAYYAPVMEYVGGTEIAGGYLGGTMVQPQLLSSFSQPCFGLNIHIIDEDGKIVDLVDNEGELTISPPSCGLSTTLLNKDRDHKQVYFNEMPTNVKDENGVERAVLRRHGDQIRIVAFSKKYGHYYQHLGRVDDTMNLGGIKISSIALENVILRHPLLSREVAAISFRQSAVDQEELVVCCVPKEKSDLFEVQFEKKPLGIKLAPVKDNEKVIVCYAVDDEKLSEKYEHLGDQPVLYRVNGVLVYNRMSFDDVVALIQGADVSGDNSISIQFLRQRFNPQVVQKEVQVLVKKELNPLFRVRDLYLIDALPRTASGKVMRRILRKEYNDSRQKK